MLPVYFGYQWNCSDVVEPRPLDEKWANGRRHSWTRSKDMKLLNYTTIPATPVKVLHAADVGHMDATYNNDTTARGSQDDGS